MASHRKPKTRALGGRPSRTAATLATAAAASMTTLAQLGHAVPQPPVGPPHTAQQPDATQARTDAQTRELRGRVVRLQADVARDTAALGAARTRLGALAAEARHRGAPLNPALRLALSDDPRHGEHAAALQRAALADQQARDRYGRHGGSPDERRAEARRQLARLGAQEAQLAAEKRRVRQRLRETGALLSRLTAEQPRYDAAARAAAFRVPASPAAQVALAFARAQLGKPYVWGAAGPGAYDCSGLVQAAWRAAGVPLPRTTHAQAGAAPRVPRTRLRPGDLVFFYPGFSHVGIYVGHGRMIHAPHPGAAVRYASVDSMPFAGAVRPG